jgi:hypothetical protein
MPESSLSLPKAGVNAEGMKAPSEGRRILSELSLPSRIATMAFSRFGVSSNANSPGNLVQAFGAHKKWTTSALEK